MRQKPRSNGRRVWSGGTTQNTRSGRILALHCGTVERGSCLQGGTVVSDTGTGRVGFHPQVSGSFPSFLVVFRCSTFLQIPGPGVGEHPLRVAVGGSLSETQLRRVDPEGLEQAGDAGHLSGISRARFETGSAATGAPNSSNACHTRSALAGAGSTQTSRPVARGTPCATIVCASNT